LVEYEERDTNGVINELREFEDLFFKSFRLSPLSITIIRISDGLLIEVNEALKGSQDTVGGKPSVIPHLNWFMG